MKTFAELKEEMKFMKDMFTEPVDGEEEMVDADGDRVPGGNGVVSTDRTF